MTDIKEAKGYLARRRTAYVKTFDGTFSDEVLQDLAKFCRAHESTFHPDPRVHAALEGRREVWLRIEQHLKLSDEDLWRIFAGAPRQKANA
jgi:hypothetical protein